MGQGWMEGGEEVDADLDKNRMEIGGNGDRCHFSG
jgi:hypothetical protein